MAEVGTVSVWYDEAGDYLEVLFAHKKGYFRETDNDAVMEKVDESGQIKGERNDRRTINSIESVVTDG